MPTDLLIISIVVVLGGLVVLALLGGVFWYFQRLAADEKQAPASKPAKAKTTKATTQAKEPSADQSPPATDTASPA